MNALVPFDFDGSPVRAFPIDGDPWFVGKDVAGALGYRNVQHAIRTHCKAARPVGVRETLTPTLDPQTVIIPERDVFRLMLRSKLPSAERFEELVVGTILPTIRKTGSFGAPAAPDLRDPKVLLALLADYAETAITLKGQVAELAPAAAALDRIAVADGSMNITEAAKTLQVRPKELFTFLRRHGWVYRRAGSDHDVAYQDKIAAGLLEHKTATVERPDGSDKVVTQVRVTAKGLARLGRDLSGAQTDMLQ
jgi:anti-repressor protein